MRVIHIGCADHISVIDSKMVAGNHLHSVLEDKCEKVIGFDLSKDAISHLVDRHGMSTVHHANIEDEEFDIRDYTDDEDWDYVVLGEILEHVDNPVLFLKKVLHKFKDVAGYIVISVPNAYSNTHVSSFFTKHTEIINSDHRYWFTPYTLLKVMHKSGIRIADLTMADPETDITSVSQTLIGIGEI